MDTTEVIAAFLQGFSHWRGCSWPTEFGNRKLNLDGLKASQAALMAGATSGDERANWVAAVRWLRQVERDAREAEDQAELAADLAILSQPELALSHVKRACALESQYTVDQTWRPLLDAITKQLGEMGGCGCRRECSGNLCQGNVKVERGDEHVCGKSLRASGRCGQA